MALDYRRHVTADPSCFARTLSDILLDGLVIDREG